MMMDGLILDERRPALYTQLSYLAINNIWNVSIDMSTTNNASMYFFLAKTL